jgi:diguanylate cyclase (GGDEF)-like protein/PAS domain S-box-containing protein
MGGPLSGYSQPVAGDQGRYDAFKYILDAISDGVYVVGPDRTIVYWSAGAERITGYSAGDVVGRRCDDDILAHTDLAGKRLCAHGCPLQDCIESGREHSIREVFLRRKDGERLAVYVKTAAFELEGRRHGVEVFGELESVAGKDLAARIQELSDSAVSDPLTGLFNRRYLDAALAQQFSMYQRLGRRYGIIQMDIDTLKEINDRLGHATGDDAIRFVAGILAGNAREMDIAARLGGDEFVVICGLAGEDDLAAYGRRLVRLIHDSRFAPVEDAGLRLTVSAGGALVAVDDRNEREALRRADQAMYAAKHGGRDEFVVNAGDGGRQ